MTGFNKSTVKDVSIKIVGPIGDVVSEWTLKGTWIKTSNFGDLDWSSSDAISIQCSLRFDYPILQY